MSKGKRGIPRQPTGGRMAAEWQNQARTGQIEQDWAKKLPEIAKIKSLFKRSVILCHAEQLGGFR
jgi:hypothetical protein